MPAPADPKMFFLKISVDNSIIQYLADINDIPQERVPKIETTWSIMP
jgi:hypothetical protein